MSLGLGEGVGVRVASVGGIGGGVGGRAGDGVGVVGGGRGEVLLVKVVMGMMVLQWTTEGGVKTLI